MTQLTNGKGGGTGGNTLTRSADAGNDNRREEPFVDDVCGCVVCRSDMAGLVPCREQGC